MRLFESCMPETVQKTQKSSIFYQDTRHSKLDNPLEKPNRKVDLKTY